MFPIFNELFVILFKFSNLQLIFECFDFANSSLNTLFNFSEFLRQQSKYYHRKNQKSLNL